MDELSLCLVTDRAQTRERDLVDVVRECLGAGLQAVQLREKDLGAADLAVLGRRLRDATHTAAARLVVNDRVDVALAVDADAVQRTSTSLSIGDIRAVAGQRLRIGASVHSLAEALDAERAGADWIVFGPIFDTPSKRRFGAPQGLAALRSVTGQVRLPVVAIGGITPERVSDVLAAGATGVAVISAILSADSPGKVTREFLAALDR